MRPILLAVCAGLALLSACATSPPPPVRATAAPRARPHAPAAREQASLRAAPPPAFYRPPPAQRYAAPQTAATGPRAGGGRALTLDDELRAEPADWDMLPGWREEDHVAALDAFAAGCSAAHAQRWLTLCARARELGSTDEDAARRFFETNFRPAPAGDGGLLTAYYTPVYEIRTFPDAEFSAPLRPRPDDIAPGGQPAGGYADRAQIEAQPSLDARGWMRPEDLFFLQIQGSGVLVFPDGTRRRAVFDGTNGAPFTAIGSTLRQAGALTASDATGNAVHAWLAAHRGDEAQAVMNADRRYVFFRLTPDDGQTPAGAAGLRLPPGRALAVDPGRHALGEVLWIDAESPSLQGAVPVYRRLAMALDTGGAIRGDVRADLYLGVGPQAGLEAGRVRHRLKLWRLEPLDSAE
ncbi:MAG TPA: MltA domain-containing protein [Caulobacteraceae bacterium]|jgi:membrane-bound lytic murein transglycosylase A|nr:MltA domain-containing protein [Caulobacteraceae bacterium]